MAVFGLKQRFFRGIASFLAIRIQYEDYLAQSINIYYTIALNYIYILYDTIHLQLQLNRKEINCLGSLMTNDSTY
jgi:hypothetical protein